MNIKPHISNADRLLPSQPVLSQSFKGENGEFYAQLETLLHSVLPTKSIEESFDIVGKPGVSYYSLGSDLNRLRFYQFLIRMGGYKRVLELGTFIGVSTLFLAEAVGGEGHVTSIELGQEFHALANRNIIKNGMAERVSLIRACALDELKRMSERARRFDFILIDAAKQLYGEMIEPALACLSQHGLLVIDDVLMLGETLNPKASTEKGEGVRSMLAKLPYTPTETIILPIGNGLALIRRREAT